MENSHEDSVMMNEKFEISASGEERTISISLFKIGFFLLCFIVMLYNRVFYLRGIDEKK